MEKKVLMADFVTRLADKGYTKKDSAVILADVLDVIYNAVRSGETISLVGFGSFKVKRAKPKDIVNVTTGKRDTVPAHNIIKFTPGLTLKAAIEAAKVEE